MERDKKNGYSTRGILADKHSWQVCLGLLGFRWFGSGLDFLEGVKRDARFRSRDMLLGRLFLIEVLSARNRVIAILYADTLWRGNITSP